MSGDAPPAAPAAADAPDPVALGEEAVRIELPDFEGPLDLLLHLVKKHELEIVDIPIAFITEKYLAYLHLLQALNLDVAGEYLLMAATLAFLKSRELVPHEEEAAAPGEGDEDDELGDPRQELIRRLLEYQKYKEAAARLGERPVVGRNVWTRGASVEEVTRLPSAGAAPLEEVPVFRLIEALERVLSKARVKLTHDVVQERISLTDKINELVDRLAREETFTFASCFAFLEAGGPLADLRHQAVVTFLAMLEMTRLKLLRLYQASDRGEIYVSRPLVQVVSPEAVAAAVATIDE